MLKKIIMLMTVAVFALTCTLCAFAAEKQWYVIKDKKGVCKLIQATEKTPTYLAGPFPTKEAATKAKEKECPKPEKKTPEKKTLEKKMPEKKTL
ncbi:MAG: hypothetical protein HY913_19065 [Desulfomonile tiedjei]|nr:hypothetical protein [Desulfomonile tiedjei]